MTEENGNKLWRDFVKSSKYAQLHSNRLMNTIAVAGQKSDCSKMSATREFPYLGKCFE